MPFGSTKKWTCATARTKEVSCAAAGSGPPANQAPGNAAATLSQRAVVSGRLVLAAFRNGSTCMQPEGLISWQSLIIVSILISLTEAGQAGRNVESRGRRVRHKRMWLQNRGGDVAQA